MSKISISNPALQSTPTLDRAEGFNLAPNVNTFSSVFNPKPLSQEEENFIEKLLIENFKLSGAPEEKENTKMMNDCNIKNITIEIKAVQKQGIVLLGERIKKVQKILSSYKEGTFSKWLKLSFNTRQTGYNILSYYELYKSLPTKELQESFKKIPQKVAYVLANRNGDPDKKFEIIEKHHDEEPKHIIELIRETFPLQKEDRRNRKEHNDVLIEEIHTRLKQLSKRKASFTYNHKKKITECKDLIDLILEDRT